MHDVAVIIVNYRTPKLTEDAVRSALAEPETVEVVVVDNASGDGSAQALISTFEGHPVRVLESPENVGFGRANNLGAAAATATYLLLLNSDALVHPGATAILVGALTATSDLGVVAPLVLLPDGTPQPDAFGSFHSIDTIVAGTLYNTPDSSRPDWVSGVAMLLRREDFERVGGFDPRYFMYLEDVKLCWDLCKAGLRAGRVEDAKITHIRGGSNASLKSRTEQFLESQDRFLRDTGASWLQMLVLVTGRRLNAMTRRIFRP